MVLPERAFGRRRAPLAVVGLAVIVLCIMWVSIQGHHFVVKMSAQADDDPTGAPAAMMRRKRLEAIINVSQRAAVINATIAATWAAYRNDAFGCDEYSPISRRGWQWGYTTFDRWWWPPDWVHGNCEGGLGLMIVDNLDLLWLTGHRAWFREGVDWVRRRFCPECVTSRLSFFELSIRALGGLIAAYDLSGEPELRVAAHRLGVALHEQATAIDEYSLPPKTLRLAGPSWVDALLRGLGVLREETSLVSAASFQLEFHRLSAITGDSRFSAFANSVNGVILPHCKGFCPGKWKLSGEPFPSVGGLGAGGDSFYEYLLKESILSGGANPMVSKGWLAAAKWIVHNAGEVPLEIGQKGAHYFALAAPQVRGKGYIEELECFAGGMMTLSGMCTGDTSHLQAGLRFTRTCRRIAVATPSGLPPERTALLSRSGMNWGYPQRPETVESYFYAWLATGDEDYRTWGWDFFTAAISTLSINHAGVAATTDDVRDPQQSLNNRMETFWLAETLKYLFLLFSVESVGFSEKQPALLFSVVGNHQPCGVRLPNTDGNRRYIFTTEAHPIPLLQRTEWR